ncbi:hypothetical protein [Lentzea sp. NEAU-D7]|uniref:hypothetical protein n=1 Tax=Lentzea sp. NEAU-D7 TaxID=2994667 RepID=UPI00224B6F0C|nr:hypothetical protein [Lentzea sp. NEAU-D7]MCX2952754.1 hypothetical protein [Lentzea sp. NEAU-D7]
MEEAPEVNCALVDLTGISLDELRHTTDESVAASVRAVLLDVADPGARAARMSNSADEDKCDGGLLPERRTDRELVPLIKC